MLKPFVIVTKHNSQDDHVEVITSDKCSPYKYEPITDSENFETAVRLAKEINDIGGAAAWLASCIYD